MAKDWRKNVDPLIREHLESQIKATMSFRKAYEEADNKGTAQLWIAVANLSKQIFNTSMKINYIEDLMKDVVKKIDEIKDKRDEIAFMEEPEVQEEVKKTTKKKPSKRKTVSKKKPARKTTKTKKGSSRKAGVRRTLRRF